MMKAYTIGFTKKSAKEFFTLLKEKDVSILYDVRLNNSNQLAGFSKGNDLKYFLKEINGIDYSHEIIFAPTKEILNSYKNKKITWADYEVSYNDLLNQRDIYSYIEEKGLIKDRMCFLCSEHIPDKCHRRLLVEYISKKYNLEIEHL